MEPFVQMPFEDLPALPRVPHAWDRMAVQRVPVTTPALGTVEVACRTLGDGPPLLLVHGLMTTGYSWRYVVARLARRHRVIVPDLPGAGGTRAPDVPLRPEVIADHLAALMEATDAVGADVIGNSMGGYLTLWLALRHRRHVGRLVVLHAPFGVAPRLVALHGAIRVPGARAVLGGLVGRDPRRWAHANVHYWDESLKSAEEAAVYGDVLATPTGLQGFHQQLRDMMNVRDLRRLERILARRKALGRTFPCPVHLIYARRDPMVPPATGQRLAAVLPRARLSWLEEGSHFAHVDAPDAFLEAVGRGWGWPITGPGVP